MNILIVGYGNIGKHMYQEFKKLQPDIYDPFLAEFSQKQNKSYDYAFICVPTDCLPDGSCNISVVEKAVMETDAKIIVIKSTIAPGTTNQLISKSGKKIVFSPEHYGVTQHCKEDPGFLVLGGEKQLCEKVTEIYTQLKNAFYKFYFTDTVTAELSKYMLNSFLALKVTFCNEFASLAEKFGVSYPELRELFVADERVGNSHTFVYPEKPYYDSHCFNKDVPALVQFSGELAPLMTFVNKLNLSKKAIDKKVAQAPQKASITTQKDKKFDKQLLLGNAPRAMQTKLNRIQKQKISKNKAELLKQSQQTDFKFYCSICLIIRDENEYLEEWLKWHIMQGVDHFYIYDHGSKQPVSDFIKTLEVSVANKITVIDWKGSHSNAQPDAYNDCLNRFRGESKWIGYIDTDEHVRLKTGQSLPQFLKEYEDFAGMFAIWNTFDANGHKNKSNLALRERFTHENNENPWSNKAGKIFLQPMFMQEMFIHNGLAATGFEIVGEWKDVISDFQLIKEDASTDLICVDHFYTKSYEEWIEKLKRGSCHANFTRKYDEFFNYNPDLEYCREDIEIKQDYEVFDCDTSNNLSETKQDNI